LSILICIGPVPCGFDQNVTVTFSGDENGFTIPPRDFTIRADVNTICGGAIISDPDLPEGESSTMASPTS
jgi:hypothetical protein